MKVLFNAIGVRGDFRHQLVASAAAAALVAAAAPPVLAAEAASRPTVSVKNSTIESNTKVNGVVSHTITGNGNTASTNLGVSIKGANVENSKITSTTKVNGVVAHTVTGNGNVSSLNLGVEAGN